MEILGKKEKFYLLIFVLLTSLLIISCSEKAKDIFNPTIDNRIEFSLSQKTYTLEEAIKRQQQISVDSGKYLLRFSTDEIKKDTTIDEFNADFFTMDVDTMFYVLISDTIDAQMIIRRDSVGVQEAELNSGLIILRFTNYTNKQSYFELTLPGFTKQSGNTTDTLKLGGPISPNTTVQYEKDLSGFVYRQPSNQPFGSTRPGFWLRGKIYLQGGSFGDSIRVYSHVENLKFSRVKGKFKPFELGVKDQTFKNSLSSDISEFISKVRFDSISVKIRALTTIDFPIKLKNFQVFGIFNSGRTPIPLRFGLDDYIDTTIQSNDEINLNLNNLNTNINEFLSQIPDSIKITAQLILNPYYQSGEVNANDSISYSFQVDAWSRFTVNQAEWTDTFDVEISQDAREKLLNSQNGTITIYSQNEVPFEINFVGLLTDSIYNPLFYFTRDAIAGNDTMIFLQGAITDSRGMVISPAYQTIRIDLNQDDIQKLSQAYKLIQRFTLSTSERRVAEVSAKSKIFLRITGSIKIQLTSDDF